MDILGCQDRHNRENNTCDDLGDCDDCDDQIETRLKPCPSTSFCANSKNKYACFGANSVIDHNTAVK